MNDSSARDLTPVVPKRLRSAYGIAMLNYFLLGLSLASFAAPYYFSDVLDYAIFEIMIMLVMPLICVAPIIQCMQREFSYRGINVLAYCILLLITAIMLASNFIIVSRPLSLITGLYTFGFVFIMGNNRAFTSNLGPESTMARRCNFALAMLPLGLLTGILLIFILEAFVSYHILTIAILLFLLFKQIRNKTPNLDEWNTGTPDAPRPLWKRILALALIMPVMLLAAETYYWIEEQNNYTYSEFAQYFIPLSITALLIVPNITNALFKHERTSLKKLIRYKKMPIAMVAYLIVNTALLMAGAHYMGTPDTDLIDPTLLIIALFLGYTLGAKRIYQDRLPQISISGIALLFISAALPEITLWESVSLNYVLPLSLPFLLLGTFLLAGFNNTVLSYGYQGMDTHTRNASNYIANIVLAISLLSACYLA